jgi:hypothetical protein
LATVLNTAKEVHPRLALAIVLFPVTFDASSVHSVVLGGRVCVLCFGLGGVVVDVVSFYIVVILLMLIYV